MRRDTRFRSTRRPCRSRAHSPNSWSTWNRRAWAARRRSPQCRSCHQCRRPCHPCPPSCPLCHRCRQSRRRCQPSSCRDPRPRAHRRPRCLLHPCDQRHPSQLPQPLHLNRRRLQRSLDGLPHRRTCLPHRLRVLRSCRRLDSRRHRCCRTGSSPGRRTRTASTTRRSQIPRRPTLADLPR